MVTKMGVLKTCDPNGEAILARIWCMSRPLVMILWQINLHERTCNPILSGTTLCHRKNPCSNQDCGFSRAHVDINKEQWYQIQPLPPLPPLLPPSRTSFGKVQHQISAERAITTLTSFSNMLTCDKTSSAATKMLCEAIELRMVCNISPVLMVCNNAAPVLRINYV